MAINFSLVLTTLIFAPWSRLTERHSIIWMIIDANLNAPCDISFVSAQRAIRFFFSSLSWIINQAIDLSRIKIKRFVRNWYEKSPTACIYRHIHLSEVLDVILNLFTLDRVQLFVVCVFVCFCRALRIVIDFSIWWLHINFMANL